MAQAAIPQLAEMGRYWALAERRLNPSFISNSAWEAQIEGV
jgi:hypothetical protein